ncbi:hypothetical protein HYT25_03960 [Candidatus Pacearchaeota archaeon]|nr:hypothetical protein [Candidatus Pacearchaeota archaeon]
MNNKKGQGLSVNAIILIVLGIVVLVLLVLGFTIGWSRILPFISTDNADTIATACSIACSTNSQFDFCSVERELKAGDNDLKDVTCNYLAEKRPEFGTDSCSTVSCDNVVIVDVVAQELLQNQCTGNENKIIQALIGDTLVSLDCSSS